MGVEAKTQLREKWLAGLPGLFTFVVLLLFASVVGGCDTKVCGGHPLKVRSPPAAAPDVFNRLECSGALESWQPCEYPALPQTAASECGGLDLVYGFSAFAGKRLTVHLHLDEGALVSASARFTTWTDEGEPPPPPQVVGGWVSARAVSAEPDGHQAGEFVLRLTDGEIRGVYDSHWPDVVSWYQVYDLRHQSQTSGGARDQNWLGRFFGRIPGFDDGQTSAVGRTDLSLGLGITITDVTKTTPFLQAASLLLTAGSVPPSDTLRPADTSPPYVFSHGVSIGGSIGASGGLGPRRVRVPLLLSPDGDTVIVELTRARIMGGASFDTWGGYLSGVIPADTFKDFLLPAMTRSFNKTVRAQCTESCPAGSAGGWLLAVLDVDYDGALTIEELREGRLLSVPTAPDVDLDNDGTPDGLTLELNFHARAAQVIGLPTPVLQ